MNAKTQTAIVKACQLVGGQSEMARILGVPPAFVYQWVKGLRRIPDKYALPIEVATSGKVSRKQICPDAWHWYWPEMGPSKKPINPSLPA